MPHEPVEVMPGCGAAPALRIQRLREGVSIPAYQSEHAAGLDLHAAIEKPITLQPGDIRLIPCGFAMAAPVGYEAQVRPRSGLAGEVRHLDAQRPRHD